ncbi:response regulator transcription factor [Cryptosporangium arvum]|uniref:Response regulator containing a CheY-like receiver domain and an HTH DNA-binding domain n=1 Tax=Cryptosporangium arvum DSM 44712 TaxID=927661 RepID=A0A010Z3M5_9ACTN|nr:LuxR C-terminal-related transcriptional regulator [Cryptosporangium arvum]EXG81998.1 response regulator containing a CheY-like receiver domain and an HTH DNA-binding domain [Cryptosporangium arvum DSM 44712]
MVASSASRQSSGPEDSDDIRPSGQQPPSQTSDPGVIRVFVIDDDEILLHGIDAWLCQGNAAFGGPTDGLEIRVVATAKSVTELLSTHWQGQNPAPPPNPNSGIPLAGYNDGHHRSHNISRPAVPPVRRGPYAEEPPRPRLSPVALMDLRLRDGRRVAENVRALIEAGYAVVTCSTIDDAGLVHEVGRAGALSYVRKAREAGDMRQALAAAARGERYVSQSHAALIQRARSYGVPELSGQEREALRLYASGLTMSSVARRLNVKQGTAKSYLDRVRDKYEQAGRAARTRLELRDRAIEDGVLNSPTIE